MSQTFFLSLVGLDVFLGVLLGSTKVFGSRFLGFVIDGDVKPLGGILLSSKGFVSTFA